MRQHGRPGPDEATRALTARLADLCRARPDVFASVVRRADELEAAGVGRQEARERALNEAGA
jgi:hypothetical protein